MGSLNVQKRVTEDFTTASGPFQAAEEPPVNQEAFSQKPSVTEAKVTLRDEHKYKPDPVNSLDLFHKEGTEIQ